MEQSHRNRNKQGQFSTPNGALGIDPFDKEPVLTGLAHESTGGYPELVDDGTPLPVREDDWPEVPTK